MPRALFLALLALLLPFCTSTASVPHDEYDVEEAGLEGTWRVTSWKDNGEELSTEGVFGGTLRFRFTKDREYTLVGDDQLIRSENCYKLHPDQRQAVIDYFKTCAPGVRPIARAIYRLHGRRLTVCGGLTGGRLPKDFVSKPGTKTYLLEMVRVK